MTFWIHVTGVPSHYWDEATSRDIGEALGEVNAVDVRGKPIQVSLNADKPLKMETKIEFDNGDIVRIKFKYENLFQYCFTCFHISHEESKCPLLSKEEKKRNREIRARLFKESEADQRNHRSIEKRLSRPDKDKTNLDSPKGLVDIRGSNQDQRRKNVWKCIEHLRAYRSGWSRGEYPLQYREKKRKPYEVDSMEDRRIHKDWEEASSQQNSRQNYKASAEN